MVNFEQQPARPQDPISETPFHYWQTETGEVAAMFYRMPSGYRLRFPHRADFILASDARSVTCFPVPGVSRQMIIAVYQNQVMPLLQSHDGDLILHASTVSIGTAAIGFLGKSGRGKSTLAAAFARAGYPFLSDDGLSLELVGGVYMAKPNRPNMRLWADSNGAVLDGDGPGEGSERYQKTFVNSGPSLPFEAQSRPLVVLYILGEGHSEGVTEQRLDPARALLELIKHAFILDVDRNAQVQAQFDQLAKLANAVPCFTLDYPRRYEALPSVIEKVIARAQNGGSST